MTEDKIKEFRKLLTEGKVEFDFTKKDGSVRHAVGTLNSKLMPQLPEKKTWLCHDIEWPEKMTTKPESIEIKNVPADVDELNLRGYLEDIIIEQYGEAPFDFKFDEKVRVPKKLPADSIYFWDLERGGGRSLKADSLLNFTKIN